MRFHGRLLTPLLVLAALVGCRSSTQVLGDHTYYMPDLPRQLLLIPALMIGLSLPMILNLIPRNRYYGLRTAKTLSSEKIWYRANRVSGVYFLIAGFVALLVNLVVPDVVGKTPSSMIGSLRFVGLGLLAVATLASWVHSQAMK